jgi:hypothetical protein
VSQSSLMPEVGGKPPAPISQGGETASGTELIQRAKDVIAGRVPPPVLVPPPEVEQFLRREFEHCEPPPTALALRRIADRLTLDATYRGEPVAVFTHSGGALAVLAAGEREIIALLDGLDDVERSKVMVTDTEYP